MNSGFATRFAYQSRVPGEPLRKVRPSYRYRQISIRRGCPLLRPVVVMSTVRSFSSARWIRSSTDPAYAYTYAASGYAASSGTSSDPSANSSAALSSGWITSAATAIAATTSPAATQKARW